MCGRYYIAKEDSASELQEIIESLNRRGVQVKSGEVFPSDTVAVIANIKSLTTAPFAMPWGFTMPDGRLVINARSETASDKPLFHDGMAQRRCLLPATNYFEWEKRAETKTECAIKPSDGGVMYMAGLYRIEANQARCTILTRQSVDSIAFIHDRMPVLLPREALQGWLNPRYNAMDVLRAAVIDVAFHPVGGVSQMRLGE